MEMNATADELQITFEMDWVAICGPHGFIVWSTEIHNLGLCFYELSLHLPVLILLTIVSSFYFGRSSQLPARRHKSWAFRFRKLASFFLAFLPLLKLVVAMSQMSESLYTVDYVAPAVTCLAWVVHLAYVYTSKYGSNATQGSHTLVYILWSCSVVVDIISVQLYYRWCNVDPARPVAEYLRLSYGISIVVLIFQCLYGTAVLCDQRRELPEENEECRALLGSPRVHSYIRFREEADPLYLGVALEGISFVSKLFFYWVSPLMDKGLKGKLKQPDDLHDLPLPLTPSYLCNQVEHPLLLIENKRALEEEQRADWYGSINNGSAGLTDAPSVRTITGSGLQMSLLRALHSCFALQFYGIGVLKFVADCCGFVGPLLLNKLVTFVETESENIRDGYLYAFGLFGVTLIAAFCNTHFNFLMAKVGLKLRGAIVCIIYRKTFKVNSMTLSKFGLGEIINFMSTDTDRIVNACPSFHAFWSIPFQIAVTLYLLYTQVGYAFLAGLLFSVILIPINKVIASKIGELSTKMMANKDKRVQLMAEILRGIAVLKYHVWEDAFLGKINKSRQEELRYLKYRKYLDALCVYFWATTPVLISILTIGTYVLLGNKLTAATVFTSIALLNMLIAPLNAFPWVLNGLTEAYVSLKRIQQLLELRDMDLDEYYSPFPDETSGMSALVKDGTFAWYQHEEEGGRAGGGEQTSSTGPVLHHIDLTVGKGEFVGITGRVGSGKSSLLSALLAEMDKVSGMVCLDRDYLGYCFVSQVPWLQRGSLRDNILFGKAYDDSKYRTVIDACCLEEDIKSFPDGDAVQVGEGGMALSGGQKARVALARAVYQDKEIYVMDDVLSAVDTQVAQHLFRKCITGILRDKTRILCTHHVKFLMFADKLVIMDNGTIREQGKPQNVLPDYDFLSLNEQDSSEVAPAKCAEEESSLVRPLEGVMQEEEREVGTVQWNVYTAYWKAVGHILSIAIFLSMFLMQGSRNLSDLWLSNWVTHTTNSTNSTNEANVAKEDYNSDPSVDDRDVKYYLIIYGSLGACNSMFTLFRAFIFAYGGIHAASKIHGLLVSVILKARVTFFDLTPLGRILNRFSSDIYTVDDSLPFIINILLAQFFSLLGTIFVVVYGLPWLVLIVAPLIPVYHWLQNHYRLTSRELKRLSSLTLSPLYSHFSETIAGLPTIKAFRANARFKRENEEYIEANLKCQLASQAAAQWLALRLQFLGVIVVSGVGVIAALQHQFDVADPGLIGLALSYALSVTGILGGVVNAFTETEKEMIAVERIHQYIDHVEPENVQEVLPPPYAWPTQGVVSFSNVVLKYRDYLTPALHGVTFETRPAEKIGVMGRTGAGKSSLLVALFRLCELTSGRILIDTVNIAHIGLRGLRARLAIIPQDPFLFSGTIRENLDPACDYKDAELVNAIERCHMAAVVRSMGGLDGKLSSGGTNLSVGQRQLLCLVRAVLRKAKVVCIDEATANVDLETDRSIQHTLRTAFHQSTVISIAHRASTVMDLDRVLVMGNGEVLEFDCPDVLMRNKKSHFYKLASPEYELA